MISTDSAWCKRPFRLNVLYGVINAVEAQRGRQLTDAQAGRLLPAVRTIITALGG